MSERLTTLKRKESPKESFGQVNSNLPMHFAERDAEILIRMRFSSVETTLAFKIELNDIDCSWGMIPLPD